MAPKPQQQPEQATIPNVQLGDFRPSTFNYMIREEGSPAAQRRLGHLRRAPAEVEGGEPGPELFHKYQLQYRDPRTGQLVQETWGDGEIKYTIGFGHVIDRVRDERGNLVQDTQYDDGIDITAAGNLMVGDMRVRDRAAAEHYNNMPGAGRHEDLPQDLRDLLMDMRFQAGGSPRMAAEISRGNFERAMVESWIGQTPGRSQRRREQFFPTLSQDYTNLNVERPTRNEGIRWNKWNKTPTTSPEGMPWNIRHGVPGAPGAVDYRDEGVTQPPRDPAWSADPSGPQQIQPWPGGTPQIRRR